MTRLCQSAQALSFPHVPAVSRGAGSGLLARLFDLFRPKHALPLLDPDSLSDHWRRDLGLPAASHDDRFRG